MSVEDGDKINNPLNRSVVETHLLHGPDSSAWAVVEVVSHPVEAMANKFVICCCRSGENGNSGSNGMNPVSQEVCCVNVQGAEVVVFLVRKRPNIVRQYAVEYFHNLKVNADLVPIHLNNIVSQY